MAGNGEAASTETLDAIMAKSWDETMGEDRDEVPETSEHLGLPDDKEDNVDTQEESSSTSEDAEEASEDTAEDTDDSDDTEDTDTSEDEEPVGEEADDDAAYAAPEHWSNDDRTMFDKLDDEAKEFLLRRHKQMEGDYTRKTTENAEAIKIGKLLNEGMDPAVKADLVRIGLDHESYLRQMMQWHHMSMVDPAGFVRNITGSLNLDPAQVFATQNGTETGEQPTTDPTSKRLEAVEQHLNQDQQQRYAQVVQATQKRVDDFSQEKDTQGNLIRPHFETVRADMATFLRVDPNMALQDAYDAAVYKNPELRATIIPPTNGGSDRNERTKKALRAKRSNIKGGSGGSVRQKVDDKPLSLAESLNAAADEVGLN